MVRKVRSFGAALAAVFAVTAGVLPAAAADPTDPHVSDPCGDANWIAWVDGTTVDSPDTARAAMFDIKSAWFTDVIGENDEHLGVRVNLEMCGDVPEPEPGVESSWSVRWRLADGCWMKVLLIDKMDRFSVMRRDVRIESDCKAPQRDLYRTILNGPYTVEGNHITWTLTPDTLPLTTDESAFLKPGTTWLEPYAVARDGRAPASAWGAGLTPPYLIHVVGTEDRTRDGHEFTVGETREGTVR